MRRALEALGWVPASALPTGFRIGRLGQESGRVGLKIQSGDVWHGSLDHRNVPETLREGVSRTLPGCVSSLPRFDLGHPPRGPALVSKPRDPCFSAQLSGEGGKKDKAASAASDRGDHTRNWSPPMRDPVEGASQKISREGCPGTPAEDPHGSQAQHANGFSHFIVFTENIIILLQSVSLRLP
ncbi:hypothetical protein P7K49_036275 [Saguinus oedipus]|uniref:Uncharacterized protein n=1 Tax=Saguinus oedipus TaxID=9490 RepID=A0ABQ9TJL3_SAGOE|nr:hypothetical protein P7K49_036226 [Saguinus oedipus]KAK2084928.1 hypothetical protein P7K49_036228 [Saguinus oedipus]KAK2084930.1 hypothetical protein P7K49_036230 [Saguinus oedipus]KAK2084931.1 hypothetical protein P7K49_036231 [Saguinus oedipus]KAK2084934.1 hypothetical protein P7K49_036234 [Saguinus oedipus]